MKSALIRLFILPGGVTLLMIMSVLNLILIYAPLPQQDFQVQNDRDQFPGQRRGGGTHLITLPEDNFA
jgi:hypothetical protein